MLHELSRIARRNLLIFLALVFIYCIANLAGIFMSEQQPSAAAAVDISCSGGCITSQQ